MDMIFTQAEQHRRHLERRARLWGKTAKKVEIQEEPAAIEVPDIPEPKQAIDPDAYVLAWQAMLPSVNIPDTIPVDSDDTYHPPRRRLVKEIITGILEESGLTFNELIRKTRKRKIVEVRNAAIYAVRIERPDMSFPAIGKVFDMEHTSVMYAFRKMEAFHGDIEAQEFLARKNAKRWNKKNYVPNNG